MQKLRSTTSKDTYISILDILDIHKIYNEHSVILNKRSKNQYNIFVNDEDVEKTQALLTEKLWGENETDYTIYSNDLLIKEYIEGLYTSNEKKEFFEQLLLERGFSDGELQLLIDAESERGYRRKHIKSSTITWAIIGTVGGGVAGLAIGMYIYFKKKTHPFTEEKFYAYDDKNRNYALGFIIVGLTMSYFSVEINIW